MQHGAEPIPKPPSPKGDPRCARPATLKGSYERSECLTGLVVTAARVLYHRLTASMRSYFDMNLLLQENDKVAANYIKNQ